MIPLVNVDIVIVGAGLSGLIAAHNIVKHDPALKIAILEAKDRTGGRILSAPLKVKENSIWVDTGGHFISSEQKLLLKLINELHLTLVSQNNTACGLVAFGPNETYTYEDHPTAGNIYTKIELNHFYTKLDHMSEPYSFQNLCKGNFENYNYDSISMEFFLRKQLYSEMGRKVAGTIIKTSCGMDPAHISLLNFLVLCNGTQGFTNLYLLQKGYWIEEGAQEICNRLEEKLDKDILSLNSPVSNILRTNKYIILETPTHLYKCQYTVLAIPPKQILQINFSPSLEPERCRILYQSENKHLIKFVLSYAEKFWEDNGCSGHLFNCGEGPILLCYDASIKTYPILMGYIDSPSEELNNKDRIICQLITYFGEKAKYPLDYLEKNWYDEIYSGSCPMSRPLLNNMRYSKQLVQPIGRIYWAGTETAERWNGFMEGALQAGMRASLEVIYQLRPQSITLSEVILSEYKPKHQKRIVGNWYFSLYNPHLNTIVIGTALVGVYIVYKKYR